jgi:hypothetical protein
MLAKAAAAANPMSPTPSFASRTGAPDSTPKLLPPLQPPAAAAEDLPVAAAAAAPLPSPASDLPLLLLLLLLFEPLLPLPNGLPHSGPPPVPKALLLLGV